MHEKESDPYAGAILFQFLVTLITGLFAISKGINLPPVGLLGNFILSASLYAMGTLAYFNALKLIEASESTILTSIGGVITVITAYLFLGERLTALQLFGVLLIISSVTIVSFKKNLQFNKGTLFSILGTIFYGLATTNDVYILQSFDAISYVPIISFLPGLILLLIRPQSFSSISNMIKKPGFRPLVLYCIFYGIQAVTYFAAIEHGAMASQMATIFKSEIFLTVILAAIFLHETDNLRRKIFATILTTIGVYLIL